MNAVRKTYREKLLDPRWQRRRLEVLSAADFTCRDCGSTTNTLHVHHLYYIADSEPWDYPDELLRCLCDQCHAIHGDMDGALRGALNELERALRMLDCKGKSAAWDLVRFFTIDVREQGSPLVEHLARLAEDDLLPKPVAGQA